jgi:hypothetical protein
MRLALVLNITYAHHWMMIYAVFNILIRKMENKLYKSIVISHVLIYFIFLNSLVFGYNHPITQLALAITCFVAIINNIIVTVLCSKIICKCCRKSGNSTIPIAVAVHNNPHQHQTPMMWTIPSPGQPPQYQVIYSTYQQQPMEQQSASALSAAMKSDESMNLTHLAPPPPYSTVAELQPQMK